ncbi:MAG TPA: polyprenyl synthetase family protein [Rhodocyclaceae bacterium]|nr:polyprenyl synthetase family protein [Rhodocyclaceae bacterium]HNH97627.1 polyprenyl synthetase family protein [Rhodocyclaceae bacterium]
MSSQSFPQWMADIQARVEHALERCLPPSDVAPTRLHQAMRYSVLGGGKRVRPLLAFAAGELAKADPLRLETVACAVELIHAYSLVHDDLPCMDDDSMRRGKPTTHVEYDEATALLVGDSLQTLAFGVLAEGRLCDDPARQMELVSLLARASGSRGMAGGQAIDLDAVGKPLSVEELEFMHIHKTGALIRSAVQLGAACGNVDADGQDRLDHFGKRAGLLFQVVDDILDAEADSATLGKTAGKDAAQNKPTYVSILGIGRAREMADELKAQALAALEPFGPSAQRLAELTQFIVARRF